MLTVLAVAAALLLPRLITYTTRNASPQARTAVADMRAIAAGLEQYRQDNGRYPSAAQGLLALAVKPVRAPVPQGWQTGGYVDRLPRDPWGHSYQYRVDDDGSAYTLFSFGTAGPEDGDDAPGIIGSH